MPFTSLVCNCAVGEAKPALAQALTQLFIDALKTKQQHTHIRILENEFISFAGDHASAAVMVQVVSADASIRKEARETLVQGFSTVLTTHLPCLSPDRIYITFEELPVQNIAVGKELMRFTTMHTAKSVDKIAEVQP